MTKPGVTSSWHVSIIVSSVNTFPIAFTCSLAFPLCLYKASCQSEFPSCLHLWDLYEPWDCCGTSQLIQYVCALLSYISLDFFYFFLQVLSKNLRQILKLSESKFPSTQYRNPASLGDTCSRYVTRLYSKCESAKTYKEWKHTSSFKIYASLPVRGKSSVELDLAADSNPHCHSKKEECCRLSLSRPAVSHSQVLQLLSLLTRGIIFKVHICRLEMSWLVSNTVNMKDSPLKKFTFYAMWNPSLRV